ncbi:acetyltransferase [Secundilactobacillus folii]|uniref:Acetyltransferase n=1 Tax=Secundilactobacillus folii TaxID=2678357 RepID=A0A7X2XWL8_9LACO|nr:acetyltransferase [Secundilactobacillus folii]MTV82435.1 acetyltransferase [Secundilactobacillus folii]
MQTLVEQLAKRLPYEIRVLTHDDEDQIYGLQQKHQSFFNLFLDHKLTRREAVADLDEVASEAAAAQKYYLGLFSHGTLIATLDLTVDYPLPQLVWLGQYFVDGDAISEEQRAQILTAVLATLKDLTAVQVQLLVLKADTDSQHFYQSVQFEEVSATRSRVGDQFVDVFVYQRNL